jgi:uncharacterized membrane protein
MMDIFIESLRAVVVGGILVCFLRANRNREISRFKGWRLMFCGFILIFFGTLIDITDNFDSLNRFEVIGDTEIEAILEKFVGYLLGFLLVAVGIWQWLPKLIEHAELTRRQHEMEIEEQRLQVLRATMVTVKDIMNNLVSNLNEYQKQSKKNQPMDSDFAAFMDYIVQDTTERLEKLSALTSTPEKPMPTGIGIDYEKDDPIKKAALSIGSGLRNRTE